VGLVFLICFVISKIKSMLSIKELKIDKSKSLYNIYDLGCIDHKHNILLHFEERMEIYELDK